MSRYLYGRDMESPVVRDGVLYADLVTVPAFSVGPKVVQEAFFDLPTSEHVSAVLFTNQGTSAKFTRMAFRAGYMDSDFVPCSSRICLRS